MALALLESAGLGRAAHSAADSVVAEEGVVDAEETAVNVVHASSRLMAEGVAADVANMTNMTNMTVCNVPATMRVPAMVAVPAMTVRHEWCSG